MTEILSKAAFESHVGETFRVSEGQGEYLELTLSRVHGQARPASYPYETYSLIFKGPRDVSLSQKTYRLEHDQLTPMELFFVPIGMDEQGFDYEVVINRDKKS